MSDDEALKAFGIQKGYQQGPERIEVLNGVDLTLTAGELVALRGRSGSGKSTLLHVLAGLVRPDAGDVWVRGELISAASANEQARIRNRHMGFVYQMHHLLPEFTALENTAMPLRLGGAKRSASRLLAEEMLEAVGLSHRMQHRPAELSGGERQRVAVARALIGQPAVVLADEPTGNLDRESAGALLAMMQSLCRDRGVSFLIATHDDQVSVGMDRVIELSHGRLAAA